MDGRIEMKSGEFKGAVHVLSLVIVLFFLSFCASRPDLIGKWREVGKTATVEFSKDGTFKAVDNQGMAVSGRYSLLKDGHRRNARISRRGGLRDL